MSFNNVAVITLALCLGHVNGDYCKPSQACWPSPAAWADLDASLEGSISAVVETPDASLDEPAACAACGTDPYCRITTADGTCTQDPACNRGFCLIDAAWNMPRRVAEVASADDVSKVLAFANEHDIQVTVKTTGHSFTGSSTARDSLLIFTAGLPTLGDVTPGDWTDSCGNVVATVATMKIGGGATWSDGYAAAGSDYHAVGGGCISVSAAGGWLQGGGLAQTTRTHGLGVDNVLSFEVVLADGSQVVADECSEPELFWALRGGGGGTFGVVTSATYRLHAKENLVFVQCEIEQTNLDQRAALLDFWLAKAPGLDRRWGGLFGPLMNYAFDAELYLQFVGSRADAETTFLDELEASGVCAVNLAVTEAPSYYDHIGGDAMVGNPAYTYASGSQVNWAGRIVPRELVVDDPATFRDLILDLSPVQVMGWWVGGAVADVAPDATAVHPDTRSAIFTLMTMTDEDHAKVRAALPDSGLCFNHHYKLEPAWREAAWGDHYGRLLEAKDKYDPDRRFECWHCVGYAGVDVAEGDALPDGWGRDDTPCTACGPGLGECKTACDFSVGPGRKLRFGAARVGCCA